MKLFKKSHHTPIDLPDPPISPKSHPSTWKRKGFEGIEERIDWINMELQFLDSKEIPKVKIRLNVPKLKPNLKEKNKFQSSLKWINSKLEKKINFIKSHPINQLWAEIEQITKYLEENPKIPKKDVTKIKRRINILKKKIRSERKRLQ